MEDGDIVTVSPLGDVSIAFGRLVAFQCLQTGKLIIHRVIGTKGNQYLTKGDNASEPDCLIPKKDVLGCVWQIERNGRRIYLGLGMERLAIGFISRMGLLCSLVRSWRWVRRKTRNLSPR
ncbi:MAG: S24/S26 family peptidase [Desulfobacterales bacterium]|nr:S24/S26 family peptidase [Desulfobacterales bacterium]